MYVSCLLFAIAVLLVGFDILRGCVVLNGCLGFACFVERFV